jgi:hypothetical protein
VSIRSAAEGRPDWVYTDYYVGNPFVKRGVVTHAGTYEEIDVNTVLGRNAREGWIANMGNTGGELHIWLYDGEEWTSEYYTIVPGGVENVTRADIAKIRIDSDISNTQFEIQLR